VGSEEVRGVDTTHYRAAIDLEAALRQLEADEAFGELLDQDALDAAIAQFGDEPYDVEVWIDDDGLVRRQVVDIPSPEGDATMTMEMFDFGEDVEVEVPDESDSIDFFDLMEELGQALPGD
jgi:hypothetical protein